MVPEALLDENPRMVERFQRSHAIDLGDTVEVLEATEVLGESTGAALDDARAWVVASAEPDGDPG